MKYDFQRPSMVFVFFSLMTKKIEMKFSAECLEFLPSLYFPQNAKTVCSTVDGSHNSKVGCGYDLVAHMSVNIEISQQENLLGLFEVFGLRHRKENRLTFQPSNFHSFWYNTWYGNKKLVVTATKFLKNWKFLKFMAHFRTSCESGTWCNNEKMILEPKIF